MEWGILIVGIIVVFVVLICLFLKNKQKNSDYQYGLDDNGYREYVYKTVQKDFRPYLQQILESIDTINSIRSRHNSELNHANYNAMVDIYNKANEIEKKIGEYWNSKQFNKDFSYYIGLHYASHLLGNAIKQEQQVIKNTFVECKRKQNQWSEKIVYLKYRQQRVSGKQKTEISQEIASCCKIHKQISVLASQIGATNTKYNQRVSQQHMETAKRRDYIAANFGDRGKSWKERMRKRAMLRKRMRGDSLCYFF